MSIGMLGLGAMGTHMARSLHRGGDLAGVWNRTASKAQALAAELGITAFDTPAELARRCDIMVICVSADADVRAVVQELLPGIAAGSLVLDCSTVGAGTARELHALLAPRGTEFLDCPVSGGVEGARLGTLAIMVGGEAPAFERARPVLALLGKTITYFGPSGSGQAAKATNQIMCAGIIQVVAEAIAFAKAEGLPLPALIDTLGKGAGSSWYFVNRAPFMAKQEYPAGFRVRLHAKDLRICHDMAAAHSATLPAVESTLKLYDELIAQGHGDEDISAVFRLTSTLFP
ncbi:MAG: NAD(P)-dependent oxidoreductase [Proteobacteria bacterium]|nr:NAD(P)-dependent oxidoreductase [Pseudomonadota bacterium]